MNIFFNLRMMKIFLSIAPMTETLTNNIYYDNLYTSDDNNKNHRLSVLPPCCNWTGTALPVRAKGRSNEGSQSPLPLSCSDFLMYRCQLGKKWAGSVMSLQHPGNPQLCLLILHVYSKPSPPLCSYFWFHATSTLEYHPSGNLDHAGQPPKCYQSLCPNTYRCRHVCPFLLI